MNEIILDLKQYAKVHFQFEEKMMREEEYSKLNEHTELNLSFMSKIIEAQTFKDNRKMLQDLATFLKSWFLTHIDIIDREAVAAIKKARKENQSEKMDIV